MDYIYKIRRTNSVEIIGLGETLTAHVAEYAYKPYWLGWEAEETNRKLHFQTGCNAIEANWKRHGDRPEYVLFGDPEKVARYAGGNGEGTELYIPASYVRGTFRDHMNGWFLLGWVYRNRHGELILQYRQLDALEEDPRDGRDDARHYRGATQS